MCQPEQECIFYPARTEKSLSSAGAVQSSTTLPVELAGDGTGAETKERAVGNILVMMLIRIVLAYQIYPVVGVPQLPWPVHFENVNIEFPNGP